MSAAQTTARGSKVHHMYENAVAELMLLHGGSSPVPSTRVVEEIIARNLIPRRDGSPCSELTAEKAIAHCVIVGLITRPSRGYIQLVER